jgi:hypothetical protein
MGAKRTIPLPLSARRHLLYVQDCDPVAHEDLMFR